MKFKVRKHGRRQWREITLSEASTFHDLALKILETYGDLADGYFHPDDRTHLWGFWLKGKPWGDEDAVVCWHPEADGIPKADTIRLDTLKPGQTFLFLFDFGEEHLFTLKC